MTGRTLLTASGAGITTALLVAVLVIETLPYEFSAIIGLPVGFIVGIAVLLLVAQRDSEASSTLRVTADGAAGFGYAVVLLLAVRYVDFAGLESHLNVLTLVGVALVVAAAVALLSLGRDRSVL